MKTVLPDGTVEYRHKGHGVVRYKPKGTYQTRKPADPRAVRFGGDWYLPLELVGEEARVMPETRPDSDAYEHMPRPCQCKVCRRPVEQIGRWHRKWRRDHGLRP